MDAAIWTTLGVLGGAVITKAGDFLVAWVQRKRRPAVEAVPPSMRASHASLPAIVPSRPRILVVEDDIYTGRAMRRGLEAEGIDVDVATTCSEAAALATLHPYALHVADLRLHDGDGLALLARLRTPTLVYSGANEDELASARASGVVDAVVPKDGDLDALVEAVAGLLRRPAP